MPRPVKGTWSDHTPHPKSAKPKPKPPKDPLEVVILGCLMERLYNYELDIYMEIARYVPFARLYFWLASKLSKEMRQRIATSIGPTRLMCSWEYLRAMLSMRGIDRDILLGLHDVHCRNARIHMQKNKHTPNALNNVHITHFFPHHQPEPIYVPPRHVIDQMFNLVFSSYCGRPNNPRCKLDILLDL